MTSSSMQYYYSLPLAFLKSNSPLLCWLLWLCNSICTRPFWNRSLEECGHSIWLKSRFLFTLHSEAFGKLHLSLETMFLEVTTTQHRMVCWTIPLISRPLHLVSPFFCASEGPWGRETGLLHPCRCCYSQQRRSASPSSTMCSRFLLTHSTAIAYICAIGMRAHYAFPSWRHTQPRLP